MKRIMKFWLAAASVAALATIIMPMNTGRVAAAPPGTVVVSDQIFNLSAATPYVVGNAINVSGFTQIRIVRGGGEIKEDIYLFHTDSGGAEIGFLDWFNPCLSGCLPIR